MVLNDPLANALSMLAQHEKIGRTEVIIKPVSNTIKLIFDILHKEGYIGTYEEGKGKGGYLKVSLLGKINDCGVIKPRFSVKVTEMEKSEKQYLPAKDFGVIILSTPFGIMTHKDAIEKKTGGILIAYCY
ncbi:30S ribosomal protein S8 [Candidatus Woesearchaeota archaeon]|nr:30S ribosomal protein S8 [Candidatus Woesearchaeota archaeon]MBW3013744.1 30S ribosomal protein S8 [Candidatus Woesearchaeota archaeon]